MGLGLFSSCKTDTVYVQDPRNPDPRRFRILRREVVGGFFVVEVKYPNCTNYEGRKVMVYDASDMGLVVHATALDPHFCDHPGHLSPVARFEPTDKGWGYAIAFALAASNSHP